MSFFFNYRQRLAVAKELGLRSDFVSPDDKLASVRKPCKTTKPQLFGLPLVGSWVLFISIFFHYQVSSTYHRARGKGQALLQFLDCGKDLCELQMCLTLCGGLLPFIRPLVLLFVLLFPIGGRYIPFCVSLLPNCGRHFPFCVRLFPFCGSLLPKC